MKPLETVRWGILGCGDVCERKSGPPMYLTGHSQLAAVMRRDAAKAADFARRHGVGKVYTDVGALLADPGIDIIYVATPHALHCAQTIRALEAGKDVYVEKPMAMTHAECLGMLAAAERCGRRIFVAYYRRALPYFRKVRKLLEHGAIGTPLCVEVRYLRPPAPGDSDPQQRPWRLQRDVGGDGYFYDMAPHTLDILDFLLGEIAEARGCKANRAGLYEVADTVCASWRFASGAVGAGTWCFAAPSGCREDSVRIVGSRGEIRFSTFAFTPVECSTPEGVARFEIAPPEHIQGPLIETIVAELRGEGRCPSTGVSAARTSRAMDRIMAEEIK